MDKNIKVLENLGFDFFNQQEITLSPVGAQEGWSYAKIDEILQNLINVQSNVFSGRKFRIKNIENYNLLSYLVQKIIDKFNAKIIIETNGFSRHNLDMMSNLNELENYRDIFFEINVNINNLKTDYQRMNIFEYSSDLIFILKKFKSTINLYLPYLIKKAPLINTVANKRWTLSIGDEVLIAKNQGKNHISTNSIIEEGVVIKFPRTKEEPEEMIYYHNDGENLNKISDLRKLVYDINNEKNADFLIKDVSLIKLRNTSGKYYVINPYSETDCMYIFPKSERDVSALLYKEKYLDIAVAKVFEKKNNTDISWSVIKEIYDTLKTMAYQYFDNGYKEKYIYIKALLPIYEMLVYVYQEAGREAQDFLKINIKYLRDISSLLGISIDESENIFMEEYINNSSKYEIFEESGDVYIKNTINGNIKQKFILPLENNTNISLIKDKNIGALAK